MISVKLYINTAHYDNTDIEILSACIVDSSIRSYIVCSVSAKDLARQLVRVKSSNLWSTTINVNNTQNNTGDMLIQFKSKNGGPGDIYMYFDVPVIVYRKLQSATSKGHYFWKYIRNNYKYRKLTGNKRGVLPNAIN